MSTFRQAKCTVGVIQENESFACDHYASYQNPSKQIQTSLSWIRLLYLFGGRVHSLRRELNSPAHQSVAQLSICLFVNMANICRRSRTQTSTQKKPRKLSVKNKKWGRDKSSKLFLYHHFYNWLSFLSSSTYDKEIFVSILGNIFV